MRYLEIIDIVAISGFYKDFKDPIELTFFVKRHNNSPPKSLVPGIFGAEIKLESQ